MFLSSQEACFEALMVALGWHTVNWKATSQKDYGDVFF